MAQIVRLLPLLGGALAVFCYSVLIHLSLVCHWPQLRLMLAVGPFAAVLVALAWQPRWRHFKLVGLTLMGAVAWSERQALLQSGDLLILLQYASTYATLGWMFAQSLQGGHMPLCTQMAQRVRGDDMPAEVLRYTRTLTGIWAAYFGLSLATSLLLYVLAPRSTWSLFDNLVSPLVMALLFICEYPLRLRLLPHVRHSSVAESVHLMRLDTGGNARARS